MLLRATRARVVDARGVGRTTRPSATRTATTPGVALSAPFVRRTVSLLLVLVLLFTSFPQQVIRFAQTGQWPLEMGVALATPTPPTVTGAGAAASGATQDGWTYISLPVPNHPTGTVILVVYSASTVASGQDIVSVTDETTGAAYTRIGANRLGRLGVGAFWHRKLSGEGAGVRLNLALTSDSQQVPSTRLYFWTTAYKVENVLNPTAFEFATTSSYESPNSTSVGHPDFAVLTDGALILSLAGFLADTDSTVLGAPSGTNPTFTSVTDAGSFGPQTGPGLSVNKAPAVDTNPIGARTFTASAPVAEATVLVFAAISAGSETGAFPPYTLGFGENDGTGAYTTGATDLAMPGRLLPLAFARGYNSSDSTSGPLGPAWTHSFNWTITDGGATATVRRGDGRRDRFTSIGGGNYSNPPDVFDRLVKNGDNTFTFTLKNQVRYEFSTAGALTRIHEPSGNQILLTYTTGKLTGITDTVGRAVTLVYNASNKISELQAPLSRKLTYTYDANGRLATVTDMIGNATGQNPLLHRWQYAYEGTTSRLTTITDPDGRLAVQNVYREDGRLREQRDGLNNLTTFAYNGTITTTTSPRGHTGTSTYDARFRNLTQSMVVSGQTLTTVSVFDPAGNRLSFTDGNGRTTDFTYDGSGNMLTKTDPQVDLQTPRYVTTFEYDAKNNLWRITDARNFVTTRTFDPTTNVLLSESRQIDATTSAVTKYEYTDAANPGVPTRIIAPRGNLNPAPDYAYATNLTYTSGNLTMLIDPDAAKATFAYDAAGRQTSRVAPDGYAAGASAADHTWTTTYDENDQVKSDADPLGGVVAYGYDGAGNRASVTDRNGNVTSYIYDASSRLWKVQQKPDPVGNPTLVYTSQITRDPNGNATAMTQANGVVTDYGYDQLDRLTSYSTHPDGATTLTTTLTLDGNGNVLTKTTPPGADQEVTTNTYDALSRLKTVAAAGLTTIQYEYDATSNRTQMTDGTGVSSYVYDGLGRLTQAVQPNGTLSYGYDRDGNRTSVVYPAGADTVTYVYTPGGRLDHLTDAASRTSTYSYTASGLAKTLLAPNGLLTKYDYDRAQRLTSVHNSVGPSTRSRHAYTLDREGNRTALYEFVEGITSAPSTTWTASAQVNAVGTGVQDHPAIALGADAWSYLIWDDARSGNADIWFARRDPATGTWSANVKVSDNSTRIQINPAISLDGAGNAYAVWQDERNGAGKPDIFYSKRTAATGNWLTPNVKVSDESGGGGGSIQRNPRIAGTVGGAETAVWVDFRQSQKNIWSSQLAAGGASWATNKKVTDNFTADKDFPDVAVGADGTAYAVWQDSRNGNPDIYYAKLPPGATSVWSANVKVSDDPGNAAQTNPRIGIDSTGNLTVVWLDARTSPAQLRMSRMPAGHSSWSASSVVADGAARPLSVALSVRPDGMAMVAFHDNRAGANFDIYTSAYDPWLGNWSISTLASDDPGSAVQQSPTVAYGAAELLAAWRDDRAGNADVRARRAALTGTDQFAMTYDGLDRLTGVNVTNPESFVLDPASNISSRTGPPATNTYDTANRLTSDGTLTYVWSQSDRLISRGSDTFTYDALDRLTGSTVSGTARTYAYNGGGLLQSRTQGSATTFLWDPSTFPAKLLKVGGDRIIHGLSPLYAVRTDGSTMTFSTDGIGSLRAEHDSSGATVASLRYRAYGETAQANGAPAPSYFGYAGQLLDPSGLYYLRARWYDGATGRFVSRDPWMGDASDPMSLNPFGYANLNPFLFTDHTGAFPCQSVPNKVGQLLCEAGKAVGTVVQRSWDRVQRFFQRPTVQQGVHKGEEAVSRAPAAQRALLNASEAGRIIGWGTGQTASDVARTQAVTRALTTEGVQAMIAQGLTRAFVQNQLASYINAVEMGGQKLRNAQLLPRLELMQKILELWPNE